jgi:hypothetical protein
MSRLPNPGGDDGQWGNILNDFLAQALDSTTGALKPNAVGTAQIQSNAVGSAQIQSNAVGTAQIQTNAVTAAQLQSNTIDNTHIQSNAVGTVQIQDGSVTAPKLSASGPSAGQVLGYDGTAISWSSPTGGTVPSASNTVSGTIILAGDLGGVSSGPTVAKIKGVTLPAGSPTSGQVLTATSASATSWVTPSSAPVTTVAGRTGAIVISESDITNLSTDLAAKATDSTVVHLTGAETIAGTKNFTGTLQTGGQTVVATNDVRLNGIPANASVTYGKLSASGATTGQVLSYDGSGLAWTTPTASGSYVDLTTAQTVGGVKTFTSSPVIPQTPSTATQAASKGYVDTQIAGVTAGTNLTIKDEGTTLTAAPTSINFVGSGVTATNTSNAITVTVPGASGGGGGRTVTSVKNSAYTPAAGEYVIVNSTAGGFTVTLPVSQASGACISLKSISTNSNAVSIVPGGSDHIEDNGNYDGLSVSLNSGQTDMDFVYDGVSRWYRVG